MKLKALLATIISLSSTFTYASEITWSAISESDISVGYNVWFQDHETQGKRYVSAQNNLVELTAHTQMGYLPNFKVEFGKAESNLFAYTQAKVSAFYEKELNDAFVAQYGLGVSARYDARHGKEGEPTTNEWSAYDPYIIGEIAYTVPDFNELTFFAGAEKRFNKHNDDALSGTTAKVGASYTFIQKNGRSISAEIGYIKDVQNQEVDVTKTTESEDPDTGDTVSNTVTVAETAEMIGDGFYLGVNMRF